jgi:hypothetical protein
VSGRFTNKEGAMSAEQDITKAKQAIEALEEEQRARYRPKPQPDPTPAQAFLDRLNASCSETVSVDMVDAGWLR